MLAQAYYMAWRCRIVFQVLVGAGCWVFESGELPVYPSAWVKGEVSEESVEECVRMQQCTCGPHLS